MVLLAIVAPAWGEGCREIEVGVGHLSGDEFRYDRYAGVDDGVYGILDLLLCRAIEPDDARHWSLHVRDAGLDSRYLAATVGEQGRYRIDIEAQRWPTPRSDGARTPLLGIGGDRLTLPADWTAAATTAGMANLLPSLHDIELRHGRHRRGIGVGVELPERWSVETHYHHETRQGLRSFAGVIGNTGGNARAIALPEPVDQRTRLFDAAVRYAGAQLQLRFGFHLSLFDNAWSGLSWQSPFATVSGWHAAAGHPNGIGQAQLAPDNRFHQLSASAGYDVTPNTRLNADLAVGRMRQDQAFLPYTINPALAASIVQPLPRDSLDGRIDTTLVNLRLASRPSTRWHWTLGYRYDERDNQTPRDEYVGIGGDSEEQDASAASSARRYNLPVGHREQALAVEAGYRHSRRFEASVGAERRETDRTWSARSDSDETQVKLNLRSRLGERFSGGVRLLAGARRGSTYLGSRPFLDSHAPAYTDTVAGGFENLPGLRQYHLADRDRRQGTAFVTFTPNEAWTLGLSHGRTGDDYDRSEFGLRESRIRDTTADASYAPAEGWTVHAFAARESLHFAQAGRSFQGGAGRLGQAADPNRDWFARHRDHVNTAGAGIGRELRDGRFKLGVDYAQSRAVGRVEVATGPALTAAPLPDTRARLRTLDFTGDWRLRANATLRLRYRLETFRSSDWALDGVEPHTLANVILLGEDSPDYRVHALALSLRLGF